MPRQGRRNVRVVLSAFLLLGGVLLGLAINDGTRDDGADEISSTVLSEPALRLHFGRQQLSLVATTSSAQHEATLRQLITDQFDDIQVQTEFRSALKIPPEWDATSARLLYLVAATSSAEATIDADGISIRGVSDDSEKFQERLEFLQEVLPEGTAIQPDVLINDSDVSTAAMCKRNFARISQQTIRFRQSSTTIRKSSFPLLDRLNEFAYDCRAAKIAIIGHTDATGEETWNLQVSKARAQAVADHLIASGVAAERLIVEGQGSQHPLAENDTVQGRERNRRIEIELRRF